MALNDKDDGFRGGQNPWGRHRWPFRHLRRSEDGVRDRRTRRVVIRPCAD